MKFKDCEFNFYTAHYGSWANDKRIVFRVRNNKFPQNRAEEKRIENYDRIIPASKVEKYCQNNNIAYELIACGHYPFSYFTDFKDIINIREENKNEF